MRRNELLNKARQYLRKIGSTMTIADVEYMLARDSEPMTWLELKEVIDEDEHDYRCEMGGLRECFE